MVMSMVIAHQSLAGDRRVLARGCIRVLLIVKCAGQVNRASQSVRSARSIEWSIRHWRIHGGSRAARRTPPIRHAAAAACHPEPPSPTRNAFRRDCDRIIHSTAFRRLAHKTQVFVFHEGDHFRTRLTHTLEVTQIARSLARALGLDEDLAEALGARPRSRPSAVRPRRRARARRLPAGFGGFDHNAQTLRVVTALERRYADFDGLNLTWETLEGLVKHNGPLTDRAGRPAGRYRERGLPRAIADYSALHDLQLWSHRQRRGAGRRLADDIAYDAHDIDDGLRAELFAARRSRRARR